MLSDYYQTGTESNSGGEKYIDLNILNSAKSLDDLIIK